MKVLLQKFISEISWKQTMICFLFFFIGSGFLGYLFKETDEVFFSLNGVGSVSTFAILMSFIFSRSTKKVPETIETSGVGSNKRDLRYYIGWYIITGGFCSLLLLLVMSVASIFFILFTQEEIRFGTIVGKSILVLLIMFLLLTLIKIILDRLIISTNNQLR